MPICKRPYDSPAEVADLYRRAIERSSIQTGALLVGRTPKIAYMDQAGFINPDVAYPEKYICQWDCDEFIVSESSRREYEAAELKRQMDAHKAKLERELAEYEAREATEQNPMWGMF